MGCLLELLKNENTDYPVFKPLFAPTQTNGHQHNVSSTKATKPDMKAPKFIKTDLIVNGDSDLLDDSVHFQKKALDYSNHTGEHIRSTPTQTHSKKPDSLDLSIVNGDSTIKPTEQKKAYAERLAEKDQHTSL